MEVCVSQILLHLLYLLESGLSQSWVILVRSNRCHLSAGYCLILKLLVIGDP